jgi:glycosyltransferase involved in cell wall biosynthesis
MRTRETELMTTVTVVVPYFNGMNTIERALDSVREQSVAAAEIIVVNDGSDSENTAFVHALAQRDNFRLIDRLNGGQGAARNDGIRAATTPFVCLLDQDDFYRPEHMEKLLAVAEAHEPQKLGFVYSDVARGNADRKVVVEGVIAASGVKHPLPTLRDMLARDIMILPSSMLLHRANILELGGFDERFVGFEDDDLVVRCHLAGLAMPYLPESLTVWTLNQDSASFSPRMSTSRWLFFIKLLDTFSSHGDNLVGGVIAPRFVRSFIGEYLYSFRRNPKTSSSARTRVRDAISTLMKTGQPIPATLRIVAFLVTSAPRAILAPLYALYERMTRPSQSQRTP